MAIARADGKAGAAVELAGRIEVADDMHDMVETARHSTRPQGFRKDDYFTAENAVDTSNWLTMLSMIWPSSSLLARPAIQSGSVRNAAHFFSRSVSGSHARQ